MWRALALVLLIAATPAAAQDVDAMSSILLVSKKDMRDPFFRDSVVLVTHRLGPAPVGIIINRPTGIVLATALPEAKGRPKDEVVFFGGPVQTDALAALFRTDKPPKEAVVEVLAGVYLTMSREVMNELLARTPPVKDIRFFAGYAGWSRGQLENEVARGDWHLVRADGASIFEKKPETMWRELERRSGAKGTGLRGQTP